MFQFLLFKISKAANYSPYTYPYNLYVVVLSEVRKPLPHPVDLHRANLGKIKLQFIVEFRVKISVYIYKPLIFFI